MYAHTRRLHVLEDLLDQAHVRAAVAPAQEHIHVSRGGLAATVRTGGRRVPRSVDCMRRHTARTERRTQRDAYRIDDGGDLGARNAHLQVLVKARAHSLRGGHETRLDGGLH